MLVSVTILRIRDEEMIVAIKLVYKVLIEYNNRI